ncbi:hypothetical protein QNS41_004469 [Vibrio parahaemolyticus]|nr:hypothetical protein [Vibrio parahaemolyticus]
MKVAELEINKIYILETLDPTKDRMTGEELNKFLVDEQSYKSVRYSTNLCTEKFKQQLEYIVSSVNEEEGVLLFIEAHGSDDGISTRNGFITWSELKGYLVNINRASSLGLVVVFSCCFGVNFYKETSITSQAPYYVMAGADAPIAEHKVLDIAKALVEGFISDNSLSEIEQSCNDMMQTIDANYTILDTGELCNNSFEKYLIKSYDESDLRLRAINNFLSYRSSGNNLKLSYSDFKSIMYHIILDMSYLENKFYDIKGRFLLTDEFGHLNERFDLMFDELAAKHDLEAKYKEILERNVPNLTMRLRGILNAWHFQFESA